MGLFNLLKRWFWESDAQSVALDDVSTDLDSTDDKLQVNPTTGLPMVGGIGGVDIDGNPFGTDLMNNDSTWDSDPISNFDSSPSSWGG